MSPAKTAAAVTALKACDYEALPEGFKRADALALFKSDDIDDKDLDAYVEHLVKSATKKTNRGLRLKKGEKGYISLSGGQLGVAFNRPVVVKASTALALLVTHRDEILEYLKDGLGGFDDSDNYETETRTNDKGTEWTTVTLNDFVVGSDVDRAKSLLVDCLS